MPKNGQSLWLRLALIVAIPLGTLGAGLILALQTGLLRPFRMSTRPMAPTIQPGDVVLMDGFSFRCRKPRRGEIVVFDTKGIARIQIPQTKSMYFIMRVVGLPGDKLVLRDRRLSVNGKVAEEVAHIDYDGAFEVEVPAGKYFILGDNSWNSFDSRSWGPLEGSDILGRPILRYWPPGRFGEVDRGEEICGPQGTTSPSAAP